MDLSQKTYPSKKFRERIRLAAVSFMYNVNKHQKPHLTARLK
jgi:hypothetical protein